MSNFVKRSLTVAEVQHPEWRPELRDVETGRPLCRRCMQPCMGKRRTFCSENCTIFWRVRRSPSYLRSLIRKRDKGTCAQCGMLTYFVQRQSRNFVGAARVAFLVSLGFSPKDIWRRTLFDVDHVVPIAEGGDPWDQANLQTLCLVDHRKKTAEQARRRACANRTA